MAILFNPSAGRGKALRNKARLEYLLRKQHIDYDLFVTESENHLRELTREHARRCRTVVGAGGDSTFHIMVDEIMQTGAEVRLGLIGLGSSNDISKEFELEPLEKACQVLKDNRTRRIDLANIADKGKILKHFIGQANIGLGVWVNKYIEELSARGSRLARFQSLAGSMSIIHSYRNHRIPIPLTIQTEDGRTEGEFVVASFSNIRFWATGRMLNPAARPDDGRLDGCLIRDCSLPRLVRLALQSRRGKHAKAKEVEMIQSRSFTISSSQAFAVQADGEIVGGFRTPAAFEKIEIRVIPHALNLIA
jgi:YegS/Rv2252/BmrU family lipid kinase